jgi:hypothetical protein
MELEDILFSEGSQTQKYKTHDLIPMWNLISNKWRGEPWLPEDGERVTGKGWSTGPKLQRDRRTKFWYFAV